MIIELVTNGLPGVGAAVVDYASKRGIISSGALLSTLREEEFFNRDEFPDGDMEYFSSGLVHYSGNAELSRCLLEDMDRADASLVFASKTSKLASVEFVTAVAGMLNKPVIFHESDILDVDWADIVSLHVYADFVLPIQDMSYVYSTLDRIFNVAN